MIEFGLKDEADAALDAMVETFTQGPYIVKVWDGGWRYTVYRKGHWNKAQYDCDSEEEAEMIQALLNYREWRAGQDDRRFPRPGNAAFGITDLDPSL